MKIKQWETDATFGSDILGNGQAWGDMRGKVKTKQIGFVRVEPKAAPKKAPTPKPRGKK